MLPEKFLQSPQFGLPNIIHTLDKILAYLQLPIWWGVL